MSIIVHLFLFSSNSFLTFAKIKLMHRNLKTLNNLRIITNYLPLE